MSQKKKIEIKIQGMTCSSCEILLERKIKKIHGVRSVSVSQPQGKAVIICKREPSLQELQEAIAGDKYFVVKDGANIDNTSVHQKNSKRDYLEIGAVLIIIFGAYLFFRQTRIFDFNLGITDNMSYGLIFLIGLVAATSSCIAVAGGVLLSLAAKYNEVYNPQTKLEKFKPHLLFNLGRIISYTVLGGAIGALGSVLTLSSKTTGVITIVAALFMVLMGLRMLKLFPWLSRFSLRMPKFISHKILNLEGRQNKSVPFVMGALTFFLPCGFTQALQIYAISRGSAVEGALIMFFFSLGTLPALLSLSAISSFAKGIFARLFFKFSGVLVLILGFYNISNGLALTGNPIGFASVTGAVSTVTGSKQVAAASDITLRDGKQIVSMDIDWSGYSPDHFTIKQGVPVRWEINGVNVGGCQSVLIVPDYNITKFIKRGQNIIEFTPKESGELPFSCSMAMMRGSFTVLPHDKLNDTSGKASDANNALTASTTENLALSQKACDPAVTSCNVQRLEMEVSRERGFYPNTFNIKKGVPVELVVNNQLSRLGCMGTMVIPEYEVAQILQKGENIIRFTPTQTGAIYAACPMGGVQARFDITN